MLISLRTSLNLDICGFPPSFSLFFLLLKANWSGEESTSNQGVIVLGCLVRLWSVLVSFIHSYLCSPFTEYLLWKKHWASAFKHLFVLLLLFFFLSEHHIRYLMNQQMGKVKQLDGKLFLDVGVEYLLI